MTYKDYYAELGVAKTASPAEIKKAYRALAKAHHPDKNKGEKGAGERFKDINEANAVLSDPVERRKYDQFGADWKRFEEAGAQGDGFDWSKYAGYREGKTKRTGPGSFGPASSGPDIDDLFELLFGQQSGRGRKRRGAALQGEDRETETTLSLDEAYHGASRFIQVNGETIRVSIRPGVADRQVLRVAEKGGRGMNGGACGDLYLTVRVAQHPTLRREGNDLHAALPVALYDAVLGGKTRITVLKGSITVTLPRGTPNGKVVRLRGLGMPIYGRKGQFGNLLATVNVVLPAYLSATELELFGKLAAQRG